MAAVAIGAAAAGRGLVTGMAGEPTISPSSRSSNRDMALVLLTLPCGIVDLDSMVQNKRYKRNDSLIEYQSLLRLGLGLGSIEEERCCHGCEREL